MTFTTTSDRYTRTAENLGSIRVTASQYGLDASAAFDTAEDLAAFVALFPKSVLVKSTTLSTVERVFPLATFHVNLTPNGAVGEANEAGLRRIRRLSEIAGKAGVEIVYHPQAYTNSLTAADVEALGL